MADAFAGPSFKEKIRKALKEMAEDPFDREFDELISDVALRDPSMFPASYRGWFGPYAENLEIQVPKSQIIGLASSEVPIGSIITWPFTTFDEIYLACTGQAVSRALYPTLHALSEADSYPWGAGNGTTTFNVPNIKGRVLVGIDDADADFDALAETGGSKNLHGHTHPITSGGDHFHTASSGDGFVTDTGASNVSAGSPLFAGTGFSTQTNSAGAHDHGGNTGSTGSGNTQNLQPYVVINFIIRAL